MHASEPAEQEYFVHMLFMRNRISTLKGFPAIASSTATKILRCSRSSAAVFCYTLNLFSFRLSLLSTSASIIRCKVSVCASQHFLNCSQLSSRPICLRTIYALFSFFRRQEHAHWHSPSTNILLSSFSFAPRTYAVRSASVVVRVVFQKALSLPTTEHSWDADRSFAKTSDELRRFVRTVLCCPSSSLATNMIY